MNVVTHLEAEDYTLSTVRWRRVVLGGVIERFNQSTSSWSIALTGMGCRRPWFCPSNVNDERFHFHHLCACSWWIMRLFIWPNILFISFNPKFIIVQLQDQKSLCGNDTTCFIISSRLAHQEHQSTWALSNAVLFLKLNGVKYFWCDLNVGHDAPCYFMQITYVLLLFSFPSAVDNEVMLRCRRLILWSQKRIYLKQLYPWLVFINLLFCKLPEGRSTRHG